MTGKSTSTNHREAKLEALRAALLEGELSGPAEEFDIDAFIEEMNREADKSLNP